MEKRFVSVVSIHWSVLCTTGPLIRETRTTGEARKTGAPLIVSEGTAAEERGLAKNKASLRRTEIQTCTFTHLTLSLTVGKEYTV